jgi:hypothetical protein
MQAASGWDGLVGPDQDDVPCLIRQTQNENLAHEFADLAGREVNDGKDLFPDQGLGRIMRRDLRRGLPFTDFVAKVDPKLDRRFARLWIGLGPQDDTNANIDLEEIIKGNLIHSTVLSIGWRQRLWRGQAGPESLSMSPSGP